MDHLRDGVFVGALDQDRARPRVSDVLHKRVLVVSQDLLVNLRGVRKINKKKNKYKGGNKGGNQYVSGRK